jgi:1-pyrroline-5-carboxylate dehydrogenase
MLKGFFNVPQPQNEPVLNYGPRSVERGALKAALGEARAHVTEIPMYIGSELVYEGQKKLEVRPPHDHQHLLATFPEGDAETVNKAIDAALAAKPEWEAMPWEQRATIFLKAAELLSGPYRAKVNAATMLGQSKNAYQAEIDSACELIDFLRFNVHYMAEIYAQQPPINPKGIWNRVEQRPLEGFVFALTPFNFTAIAGNLPASAAMMGNVVVWKPAYPQVYAANLLMQLFKEAGLPDGVINLIYVDGPVAGDVIFNHPDFAGIHFTGSTGVFQKIWQTIGNNIHKYRTYPRVVGETGGKDFVMVHPSADLDIANTALVRGAFEYQGQKCSAASRAYIPASLWPAIKEKMQHDIASFKIGPVEDFENFINAVITEASFDKLAKYIDAANADPDVEVVAGGEYDKSRGWFVDPTVLKVKDPYYVTMCDELFGPVLTVYVYEDDQFDEVLEMVDKTSVYALTGAIISQDRYAISKATYALRNSAGNFYINDKPTGAVVGQQPFGGARASGTNDKAGSALNLLRWVSPRTIKETLDPPKDYRYPFLNKEI